MILLFGRSSMIGRAVIDYCTNFHYKIIGFNKEECDCRNFNQVLHKIEEYNPTYVISLVGVNGNISMNSKVPADICGQTVLMNMNIMHACVSSKKVIKTLIPISSCAYGATKDTLKEEEFLDDKVHSSVEAHGYARRFLYIYGQQLNKQYGNKFVFPVLNNNFGPFDNFQEPSRLKVFGTLIQRFIRAERDNDKEIVIWGSGKARREGIYSQDSGRLLVKILAEYEQYDLPINLGLGNDISIYDLVHLIKYKTSFSGEIKFDPTKPEGQMKKLLDVTRAKELGFSCENTLEEGIEKTIAWYNKIYPNY